MPPRSKKPQGLRWDQAELAPVILIGDGEEIVGDWAVQRLADLAHDRNPATEVHKFAASAYAPGHLATLTSPSLFGEDRFIVASDAHHMNDAFLIEALEYIREPALDVVLLIRHGGGTRGKRLLDAISAAKFQKIAIPALKYDSDKAELIRTLAARKGRRINQSAIHSLVDALGKDTRSLVSAVDQLFDDVEGTIDEEVVHRYYAGRTEATGFAVADAVAAGQVGRASALARHALATGASPVSIVYALAMKFRNMNLALASRERGNEVGMSPWQLDRAKKDVRGWSDEGLAQAVLAIAQADVAVKGASKSPEYAVEHAILQIGRAKNIRA